jgi:prephenate dehydrogenase
MRLCDLIVGYEPDPTSAALARQRGIVDRIAATPEEAVAGARLVVLAAPVRSLVPLAHSIAGAIAPDAVVIDIGSVKQPVVDGIEATPLAGRFVGCHPLAGTEATGAAAADDTLYRGKPCFVCPGPAAQPAAVARARAFWTGLEASVLMLDPRAHDLFMAAASHLPHASAFALAASLGPEAGMLEQRIPPSYPPTSLRDCTRVAASSPIIWRDILLANREHLLPLVRGLESCLAELRASLEAADPAALERLLERGRATRSRIVR